MFEELLRTPAGRAEHGTQVFFVVNGHAEMALA
ncbi:hypothetical protein BX265_0003 [Streptomyces sp. TLI_235]|nr:hypothetical protein BX265_8575 [Streptomyces sp. TLI_235]PBC75350.1 hypothetical protein BX265_0003 [Streptomyces sp. TLI_235]